MIDWQRSHRRRCHGAAEPYSCNQPLGAPQEGKASSLLEVILGPLPTGAIVLAVFRRLRGEPAGFGESLSKARATLLPLVGASILQGLATVGGLILLLIPGLVVLSATFVMIPALMVEELAVSEAWRRSWQLTADHRATILGLLLTTLVIALVVTLPFMLPLINLEDFLETDTKSPAFLIATAASSLVFGTFQTVLAGLAYHDLRLLKDDVAEEDLVAVFA